MNRINAFLLICIFLVISIREDVPASCIESDHLPSNRPFKILFIGNSYTYVNNLPYILEQLSASQGKKIETEMIVEGGATLQGHWEKGDAVKVIEKNSWDFVVLQEHSTLGKPSPADGGPTINKPENFHKYARFFHQKIKETGARAIFYLTWARKNALEEDQTALNEAYQSIAGELNALLAPVGITWQQLRRENPRLELYIEDNSHPAEAGSYLAACVLYTTIYRKDPIGLTGKISGNTIDVQGNVRTKKDGWLVDIPLREARLIQQTTLLIYQKMSDPKYRSLPLLPRSDVLEKQILF